MKKYKYSKIISDTKLHITILSLLVFLCVLSGCSWYEIENEVKGYFKGDGIKSEITDEEYRKIESENIQEIKEKNEDVDSVEGSSRGIRYKITSAVLYDNIKDADIELEDIYLKNEIAEDGRFRYSYDGSAQKLLECQVRVTNEDGTPLEDNGKKYYLLDLRFNSEALEKEGIFSIERIYNQPHGDLEKGYNRFWVEPGESIDFKVGFIIKEKWLEEECHLVVNADTFQGILLEIPAMNEEKKNEEYSKD